MGNMDYTQLKLRMAEIEHDFYKRLNRKLDDNQEIGRNIEFKTSTLARMLRNEFGQENIPCFQKLRELHQESRMELLRFDVKFVAPNASDIEKKIESRFAKFGLKKAIVLNRDYHRSKKDDLFDSLGKKAAEYFSEEIGDNKTIVVSCGSTINTMISNIKPKSEYKNLRVMSSIVLCVDQVEQISPPALIQNFCNRFNGVEGVFFQLPSDLEDFNIKSDAVEEMLNKKLFNIAMNADYFFLGIGSLSKRYEKGVTGGFNYLISKLKCYSGLNALECCGEISYCPIRAVKEEGESPWLIEHYKNLKKNLDDKKCFDERVGLNGKNFINSKTELIDSIKEIDKFIKQVHCIDFNKFVQARSLSKKESTVIAVAGGKNKDKAILTCLKIKNFIDVIITDSETAKKVLGLS